MPQKLPTLTDEIREFYRQKLIFELEHTYSPGRTRMGEKSQVISRDSLIRFFYLIFCGIFLGIIIRPIMKVAPLPISLPLGIITLFIAVEGADYLWRKSVTAIDFTLDKILPIMAAISIALVLVLSYLAKKFPGFSDFLGGLLKWKQNQ